MFISTSRGHNTRHQFKLRPCVAELLSCCELSHKPSRNMFIVYVLRGMPRQGAHTVCRDVARPWIEKCSTREWRCNDIRRRIQLDKGRRSDFRNRNRPTRLKTPRSSMLLPGMLFLCKHSRTRTSFHWGIVVLMRCLKKNWTLWG